MTIPEFIRYVAPADIAERLAALDWNLGSEARTIFDLGRRYERDIGDDTLRRSETDWGEDERKGKP